MYKESSKKESSKIEKILACPYCGSSDILKVLRDSRSFWWCCRLCDDAFEVPHDVTPKVQEQFDPS